ncbi:uncharacterized protein LOC121388650 [Gigantopelta aegis]|uniref:uncharacterized protein LOC121388650 n=1 Tax=Gigantopelta aegis TaxID=1735272 RepID=UPI001B888D4C|nr:uncharacterized protein LOC121388650 [Gigantopelta aegis]
MAVSKTGFESDKHLSCTICLNIFKKPKTLSCLHTFCCRCLQEYIDKQSDACKEKGFRCPVCRVFVSIPNPTAGWAAQIRNNFRIETMTDSLDKDHRKDEIQDGGEPGLAEADPEPNGKDGGDTLEKKTFTWIDTVDVGIDAKMGAARNMCIVDLVVLNQNGTEVFVFCDNKTCVTAQWHDVKEDAEKKSSIYLENSRSLKIAKISASQVAVLYCLYSWPEDHQLHLRIINVRPQLIIKEIKCPLKPITDHFAITTVISKPEVQTRLVIAHDNLLSVTDLQGKILKTFRTGKTTVELFRMANYLTSTPSGHILVSDNQLGCVVCITLEREVLWRYPLKRPGALHCDAQSRVLVVDGENKRVILLSPEGKFVRHFLTEANFDKIPHCIYYDDTKERLYVTAGDSYIRIFGHQ